MRLALGVRRHADCDIQEIAYRAELRERVRNQRDELHLGRSMRAKRLKYTLVGSTPRERAFAKVWFRHNRRWACTLNNLLSTCPTGERRAFVTKREAEVAATLVQWLATNVGFSFLAEALSEAGYTLVATERYDELHKNQFLAHVIRNAIAQENKACP